MLLIDAEDALAYLLDPIGDQAALVGYVEHPVASPCREAARDRWVGAVLIPLLQTAVAGGERVHSPGHEAAPHIVFDEADYARHFAARLYPRYRARLVVPVHDAFAFETPLAALSVGAALTTRVMAEAVTELLPSLQPRVEINIDHPGYWNKDGRADSLGRWMADPTFTV